MALVVAFIAALLIRALFFEAFRIPSESMEDTLRVGDFVLVSKFHYGPRLPVTIGLPFTNMYLDGTELPAMRLPGFKKVDRNDVIVFNVPAEDVPVDRKTHYIKRVIGLPGDTLRIVNKVATTNGAALPMRDDMKQMWIARPARGGLHLLRKLKEVGVYQLIQPQRQGDPIKFEASVAVANEVKAWAEIDGLEANVRGPSFRARVFPPHSSFSMDNYGPIYIPQRGDTLMLNEGNWSIYKDLIVRHERHDAAQIAPDTYEIDGQQSNVYVVEQDYYFVMGDNRDSSLDSRTWGFVPRDHVVGKALMVYFSWDALREKVRSDRIFKPIR